MSMAIIIGIDPGHKTGFAVYDTDEEKLLEVKTFSIHKAMERVLEYSVLPLYVRVEDARKRTWFGKIAGPEKLQGAGSIKRDCTIWEDFLKDKKIPFELVHPKQNITKTNSQFFKKITNYEGATSEHGRDAGMLCFRFNVGTIKF